jgi:hypothetical protein
VWKYGAKHKERKEQASKIRSAGAQKAKARNLSSKKK